MTAFKIPEFSGGKREDVDIFILFVTYGFVPMDITFAREAEKNKAQAFLLLSNTIGVARS